MKWIDNTFAVTAIGCDKTFYLVDSCGNLFVMVGRPNRSFCLKEIEQHKRGHFETPEQAKQIAEELDRLNGKAE